MGEHSGSEIDERPQSPAQPQFAIEAHPDKKAKVVLFPDHTMNIADCIDSQAEKHSIHEILEMPVHHIKGFGPKSQGLYEHLGIKSIRDLGNWKCAKLANAMAILAECETDEGRSSISKFNLDAVIRPEHQQKSLNELLGTGVSAFVDIDTEAEDQFRRQRIQHIEKLGTFKQYVIAHALVTLEQAEVEAKGDPEAGTKRPPGRPRKEENQ